MSTEPFSEEELQKIEHWYRGLAELVALTGPILEKATMNKLPHLIAGYRRAKRLLELKLCDKCCFPPEMCDTCKLINDFLNPEPVKEEHHGRPPGD